MDVFFAISALVSVAAFYLAPIITIGVVTAGIVVGSMILADQRFREEFMESARDFTAAWVSMGGNPVAELQEMIGGFWEVRTASTAATAERAANALGGTKAFTEVEQTIINEARQIYASQGFAELRAAQKAGQTKVVVIGGRTIQYQPGLNFEALAFPSMNGFVISDRAFVSETELAKTLAHELHRLTTSAAFATGVINAELAKKETEAAYYFAEKAGEQILKE